MHWTGQRKQLAICVTLSSLLLSYCRTTLSAGEPAFTPLFLRMRLAVSADRHSSQTARLHLKDPAGKNSLCLELRLQTAALMAGQAGKTTRLRQSPISLAPGPHTLLLKLRCNSVSAYLDSRRIIAQTHAFTARPVFTFEPSNAIGMAAQPVLQPVAPILFTDGFARANGEASLWKTVSGRFALNSSLHPGSSQSAFQFWGSAEHRGVAVASQSRWFWDDYRLEVSARAKALPACWGLVFYYQDQKHYHCLRWSQPGKGSGRIELIRREAGREHVLANTRLCMRPEQWYRLGVAVRQTTVMAFVNGRQILVCKDSHLMAGQVGLLVRKTADMYFDDVLVKSLAPGAGASGMQPDNPLGPAEKQWSDFSGKLFTSDKVMRQWAHPRSFWLPAGASMRFRTQVFHDVDFCWEKSGRQSLAWPARPVIVELFGRKDAPGRGYRFELTQNRARILRGDAELATAPVHVTTLTRLRCSVRAGALAMTMNKAVIVSAKDADPLTSGFVFVNAKPLNGWHLKAPDWRDHARVLSTHRLDYGFDAAPTAWEIRSGTWKGTHRWACVPKWSFFGGRGKASLTGADPDCIQLWNRRRFKGDFDFEVFFAPMEATSQQVHFSWPVTLNLAFSADGMHLDSGYSLVFGATDMPTQLFRKGKVVASTPRLVDHEIRRYMYRFYYRTSRTWQHLRILRQGSRIRVMAAGFDNHGRYLGLQPLLTYDDPQPLTGERLGLWTWGANGMAIARATISFAKSPGLAPLETGAASRRTGGSPDHPLHRTGQDKGESICQRISNPISGGHFEHEITAAPIDLEQHGTIEFDCRKNAALHLSLFAVVRGRSSQVILWGPDTFRPTAIPLGRFAAKKSARSPSRRGEWQHVRFDLLAALRPIFPHGPLVAEHLVLASPFASLEEIGGFGINRAGATYDIADVSLKASPEPGHANHSPTSAPIPPPRIRVHGCSPLDDFEQGLGQWERFGGWGGATLYRDPKQPASGCFALRLVNRELAGPAGAWVCRKPYELEDFPELAFHYRFPPHTELNLLVRFDGHWYEIALSSLPSISRQPRQTWPVISRIADFRADNRWHYARFNLQAAIRSHLGTAKGKVRGIILADSGYMCNRQGLVYWIDEFCRIPALDPTGETTFVLQCPAGITPAGYSHVVDDNPGTIPAATPTGTGNQLKLRAAAAGRFLHVRIRDAKGRWSLPAHLPLAARPAARTKPLSPDRPAPLSAGPPPAPYVSFVPSRRLCLTDFEWAKSPEFPEKQMQEFRVRRQAWLIRDQEGATGAGAVMIVNLNPREFYSAYFRKSAYDPEKWPRISFDYCFCQPGCALNLSFIINDAMAIVEWTGSNRWAGYFRPAVIGAAPRAIQDSAWHNVDFDLRRMIHASLFPKTGNRPAITVSEISTWATNHGGRGGYVNPPEARLKIDNFCIYDPTGRDPGFRWKVQNWNGRIKGYAYAFDHAADTVPGGEVTTSRPHVQFRNVKPGKWFFHVRAQGADNNWSRTSHRAIEIPGSNNP